MYWVEVGRGRYELMDGQQRTISLCQFVNGEFSIQVDGHPAAFDNLLPEAQKQILDYELMIYFCSGSEQEKLDWFRIINIAGERLTNQELRNAIYTGPWLADAKPIFSKTGCAAFQIGSDYVSGTPIRQDFLETAIEWASGGDIEQHMADNQNEPNAAELWSHFQAVIGWVERTFTTYRKEMKGINWGELHASHKDGKFNSKDIEKQVATLMMDEDVTKKRGIYKYALTGEEKHLSIRAFSPAMRREAYERQKGICPICKEHFTIEQMHADHITPWSKNGKTDAANCQMLCAADNRIKGAK